MKDKGKGVLPPLDASLPWVEKFRPESLDTVLAPIDVISTIKKYIRQKSVPHLLLYGPAGTGKTSTVLACAKELYGNDYRKMSLQLNASDDRGIDVVREQIKNFASTVGTVHKFKLIILDEADAMTTAAQSALRRSKFHFILLLKSIRQMFVSVLFVITPLTPDLVMDRINFVVNVERVNINEKGKEAVVKIARGDLRKALNILQSCHAASDVVDEESVYACVGNPTPLDNHMVLETLLTKDFEECDKSNPITNAVIKQLKVTKGVATTDIVNNVFQLLTEMEMSDKAKIFLYDHFASIEANLSNGCNDKLQTGKFIGAVKLAIEMN